MAGPVASYLLAAAPSYPRLFEKRCSHWHERGNRPDELGQRLSWTASVRRQSGPQRRADQLERDTRVDWSSPSETWTRSPETGQLQIPSPPPPNTAGQSVASLEPAALTAGCGRSPAAASSHSPAQEARRDQATRPWPPMMTTERSHHLAAHPGSPTNGRSARIQPLPVGHAVDLATAPPPPHHLPRRRPSPSRRLPSPAPHRRPPRPHPGRTQRTPEAGHPEAQTPAPASGHRSRGQTRAETGRPHRTLDAGRWPRMWTR